MNNIYPSITDWISAGSSVIATLVAIVMAVLAYLQFLRAPRQEVETHESNDVIADTRLTQLLVFKTSKQKTHLRIVDGMIKCFLDDTRPNKGGHQWTLSRSQIKTILEKKDYHVNPGFKSRSGVFSLGPKKNWLYSKSIFPEPEYLYGALTELLKNTIITT